MRKLLASLALAVVMFALVPQAFSAECPLGNATLHGSYVVFGTGTIVGVGPVTVVGVQTWDGQGNTVAIHTVSVNGNIFTGVTKTGTYSVNPDCTGSTAQSDGSHYDFVASPDGNSTTWIETDAGTVISGTETRLKSREEGDAPRGEAGKRGAQRHRN
jgi:hypothetical protein